MIREVHNDLLYIGDAISARDLKLIYTHAFDAVVDLAANEPPATLGRDITYCRFPLCDDGSNSEGIVELSIITLQNLLKQKFRTLVSCSAGMSRSPLISAAAWSLHTDESFEICLSRITAKSPHDISPTLFNSVSQTLLRMK